MGEDAATLLGLHELLAYGLRGVAAYAHHAEVGREAKTHRWGAPGSAWGTINCASALAASGNGVHMWRDGSILPPLRTTAPQMLGQVDPNLDDVFEEVLAFLASPTSSDANEVGGPPTATCVQGLSLCMPECQERASCQPGDSVLRLTCALTRTHSPVPVHGHAPGRDQLQCHGDAGQGPHHQVRGRTCKLGCTWPVVCGLGGRTGAGVERLVPTPSPFPLSSGLATPSPPPCV